MSQAGTFIPSSGPGSGTVTSISEGVGITLTPNPITTTGTVALTIPVAISSGGTNNIGSSYITDGVFYYDGTAFQTTDAGTSTFVLTSNGPGLAPTFQPASGGGSLDTLTGDTGVATASANNINVTGGGLTAGNSGAVFTGSSDNLQLTFNYLSLPNTTTKDFGTIYFGGSSNTIIHNLDGAFFGTAVGLNVGSSPGIVSPTLIGIGYNALTSRVGIAGTTQVQNVTAIGQNVGYASAGSAINGCQNIVMLGSGIMNGQISEGGGGGTTPSTNVVLIGNNITNTSTSILAACQSIFVLGNNIFNDPGSLLNLTYNIAIGDTIFNYLSSQGSNNIAIGFTNFNNPAFISGSNNIGIGSSCGSNYDNPASVPEANNILIQNAGVSGDQNITRIGSGQSQCFISGIDGVNVGSVARVVTEASDQLGTAVITAGTGITVTPGANTITIAATSSGGITTINVDNSGSVTGSAIDLYANSGSASAGSTVLFTASSATEIDLVVTNNNFNTIIGKNAGNNSLSGSNNTGIGYNVLAALTTGDNNICVGSQSSSVIADGSQNSALGESSLGQLSSGIYNIGIGYAGAFNYTTTESHNICLNSRGTISESNVLRIGAGTGTGTQQLSTAYISGINGVTVAGPLTNISSGDQLGVGTITSDASGRVTNANQPAFLAYIGNSVTNVTGDGTSYTVAFNATLYDQNSNFNTGTYTFTAPITGIYTFNLVITMRNVVAGNTTALAQISTPANVYQSNWMNPYVTQAAFFAAGIASVSCNVTTPLTSGDTVTAILFVTGGAKTIDIDAYTAGSPNTFDSYFNGYLVC